MTWELALTILSIVAIIGTWIGIAVSSAKARGAQEEQMKQIQSKLDEHDRAIDQQFSDRNKTNLALEGLQKSFETNMEWIKDSLEKIDRKLEKS